MATRSEPRRRPWPCRLGWHRYEPWACTGHDPIPVERCVRPGCGAGRQYNVWVGRVLHFPAGVLTPISEREDDGPPDLRIVG